jgi:hypothetical protein
MQIRHYPSTAPSGAGIEDHLLRFEGEDSMEEMDQQVREAQKRLTALRAQQEEVERQKQILENLRMKQERFVNGKKEMTEKLEKALQSISTELENTRRRIEDLCQTQSDFEDCLNDLKTFLPERWQRSQIDQELDRAINSLTDTEVTYEKGVHRLGAQRPSALTDLPPVISPIHAALASSKASAEARGDLPQATPANVSAVLASTHEDWFTWAKRGFAFNAALITALVLLLIIARLIF